MTVSKGGRITPFRRKQGNRNLMIVQEHCFIRSCLHALTSQVSGKPLRLIGLTGSLGFISPKRELLQYVPQVPAVKACA